MQVAIFISQQLEAQTSLVQEHETSREHHYVSRFTIMWEAASSNLHVAAVTGIVSTAYRQPERDIDYMPKMSECFNYRRINKSINKMN
jgi:hypothetical protein